MAKGNMLLGYSRGSVGDVVFYRDGGTQRQRARNRNPNNPKTEAQQAQRSKFANAVKFFKQVNSNFFRFAFEDKKPNESDYNAFMRHNVSRSGYIGYAANKLPKWPALGLWQLTDGSLPEITAIASASVEGDLRWNFGVSVAGANTIGQLSQILEETGEYREGDIITFVAYICTPNEGLPTTDTTTNYTSDFAFAQFILNSEDSRAITSIKLNTQYSLGGSTSLAIEVDNNIGYITLGIGGLINTLTGVACIHSRNTSSGLQVSPAWLAWLNINEYGVGVPSEVPVLAQSSGGTYYNSVLADWDAAQQAILQGSAAASEYSTDFAVVYIKNDNLDVYFSPNAQGVYTIPVAQLNNPNYLKIEFKSPSYVDVSEISVVGQDNITWNVVTPPSPSSFTGVEVVANTTTTEWTTGTKTIKLGSVGSIRLQVV